MTVEQINWPSERVGVGAAKTKLPMQNVLRVKAGLCPCCSLQLTPFPAVFAKLAWHCEPGLHLVGNRARTPSVSVFFLRSLSLATDGMNEPLLLSDNGGKG